MAARGLPLLCAALVALLIGCAPPPAPLPSAPPATPEPIQPLSFPRDDGPHHMLTEWWYYTGHLVADTGERYGFEFVIFQALRGENPPAYVAHFAITDHQRRHFRFEQKADASRQATPAQGFDLRVGGWVARGANGQDSFSASMEGYALQLTATSLKPPVPHDGDGFIDFGPAGGSYYYSRTRLDVRGLLTDHGQERPVRGQAWFDHQWGNFLVVGSGGWDWFSVQLDDGSDLTISVVRDERANPILTYGTYVDPQGTVKHLPAGHFKTQATGSWTSPTSRAQYPMGWRLRVSDPWLDLRLEPVMENQELDTGRTTGAIYWEGEVRVSGTRAGQPISGMGYVELTGYAT